MVNQIVSNIGSWTRNKIVDPLFHILQRGAEPKQLAFSAALGITFGVFPICAVQYLPLDYPFRAAACEQLRLPGGGVTIFLCGIAIALLGSYCNAPTVMLANFIATPIELSLMIPFLRLGESITGGPHFPLTADALKKVFSGKASKEVLLSIFRAILGWLVAVPFIIAGLYIVFLPCFVILVRKFSTRPSSPRMLLQPLTEDLGESGSSVLV